MLKKLTLRRDISLIKILANHVFLVIFVEIVDIYNKISYHLLIF